MPWLEVRREDRFAVALENHRARFVQIVDRGLPETPAKAASHEPLQLDAASGTRAEEIRQACMNLIRARADALELRCREHARVA